MVSYKPKEVFSTVVGAATTALYKTFSCEHFIVQMTAIPFSAISTIHGIWWFNNYLFVQWDCGANVFKTTVSNFYNILCVLCCLGNVVRSS